MHPRLRPVLLLAVLLAPLPVGACRGGRGAIELTGRARPVRADDGTELTAYELLVKGPAPIPPPRGWLFYLQGSERRSASSAAERLAGAAQLGLRPVLLERRGVSPDGSVDEARARAASSKAQRVADHRRVIESWLEGAEPQAPVILVGASEGGDVAARVAAQLQQAPRGPHVTHLVLIDAGGGWCQADELRFLLRTRGALLGLTRAEDLEAAFQRIRREPDALTLWAGHPHRRWSTFLWDRPLDDLLALEVPVFLAQGDRDESVPVESARAVVEAFRAQGRTNLAYKEYAGFGHGLVRASDGVSGFPLLEADLLAWFAGQGALSAAEAEAAAARVRRAHPGLFPSAAGVAR